MDTIKYFVPLGCNFYRIKISLRFHITSSPACNLSQGQDPSLIKFINITTKTEANLTIIFEINSPEISCILKNLLYDRSIFWYVQNLKWRDLVLMKAKNISWYLFYYVFKSGYEVLNEKHVINPKKFARDIIWSSSRNL